MRRVLMIPLLVFLLGAAGIGTWKFGLPLLEDLTAEPPAEIESSRFAGLAPFVIPIIEKGTLTRHVTLVIQLEIAGLPAEQRLETLRPRLRDAVFTEL